MTCSFRDQPICRPYLNKKDCIQLVDDWCFFIDGKQYWIPQDYYYDGASIPRLFWSLIGSPFEPDFWGPALLHDFGYFTHIFNRAFFDECLFQLLIRCGVPKWKARIMWAAVRTGGYFAWKNDNNDELLLFQLKREISKRPDKDKFVLEAK
jgi:hypothetical protein